MVVVMDAASPDRSEAGQDLSRRRVLWLGGAGLVATVSGCAIWDHPTPPPSSPVPSANPVANSLSAPAPAAPPPAPITPTAPAVNPASHELLCRASWGAVAPRPGGRPHTPVRMTIHHTAAFLGPNSNAPARLRQHQHYHQDTKGWIDIAYHISVDRNGNIYQLRDPLLAGDTATSYDTTGHFLVVCEGNFDEEQVSEEQLNGAALAFAWAAQRFGISSDTLAGHRDASPDTACPGSSLYTHVTSGDLKSRIDNLVASGPVTLTDICGPQASQQVSDIEAGLR